MSEMATLLGSHPLVVGFLLIALSPLFVVILVLFSPLLVTILLFLLAMAGLARSRRRLGRRSRRRRYKHRDGDGDGDGGDDGFLAIAGRDEGLESEKALRVNEYLEDQLKNLEAVKAFDSTADGMDDAAMVDLLPVSSSWDGLDDDANDDDDRAVILAGNCGARSDVSDMGDDISDNLGAELIPAS